jgi:CRISPR-associated protein Cas2
MWVMVLFDLPVKSKRQQRIAALFRNSLLEDGFEMCQFSVYMKFCGTREKTMSVIKKVKSYIPEEGKVTIITFTDKQFGNILHYENKKKQTAKKYEQIIFDFED